MELSPSKVANCFAHAGFSRTVVSGHDDDQPDNDRTCSDLYKAAHKIAGPRVEGDFETFAFGLVAAPATAAEIIDTVVGGPDADKKPREVPTVVQTRECVYACCEIELTAWAGTTAS
ncbi:hypothetical protein HPB48_017267 [Haemaphysalis longicornis]|uniref:Uncharacterized protein n=1 Tax=Haemaphysalis longicornis TaxID=44386 RepID=A0A9J6FPG9_HAELO|nr:hypothetical protein HPB48_017267 [Haemaphysalis longicornis]